MQNLIKYGMGAIIIGFLVWTFSDKLFSCGSPIEKAPAVIEAE